MKKFYRWRCQVLYRRNCKCVENSRHLQNSFKNISKLVHFLFRLLNLNCCVICLLHYLSITLFVFYTICLLHYCLLHYLSITLFVYYTSSITLFVYYTIRLVHYLSITLFVCYTIRLLHYSSVTLFVCYTIRLLHYLYIYIIPHFY